jgi:hypothetical protein
MEFVAILALVLTARVLKNIMESAVSMNTKLVMKIFVKMARLVLIWERAINASVRQVLRENIVIEI